MFIILQLLLIYNLSYCLNIYYFAGLPSSFACNNLTTNKFIWSLSYTCSH